MGNSKVREALKQLVNEIKERANFVDIYDIVDYQTLENAEAALSEEYHTEGN